MCIRDRLSCARARTSVILAGKCDSRRHSTTNFSENVVVAKTSYQMLRILLLSDRERASPPFNGNKRTNFCGERKQNEAFHSFYFQVTGEKTSN